MTTTKTDEVKNILIESCVGGGKCEKLCDGCIDEILRIVSELEDELLNVNFILNHNLNALVGKGMIAEKDELLRRASDELMPITESINMITGERSNKKICRCCGVYPDEEAHQKGCSTAEWLADYDKMNKGEE